MNDKTENVTYMVSHEQERSHDYTNCGMIEVYSINPKHHTMYTFTVTQS